MTEGEGESEVNVEWRGAGGENGASADPVANPALQDRLECLRACVCALAGDVMEDKRFVCSLSKAFSLFQSVLPDLIDRPPACTLNNSGTHALRHCT